MQQISPGELKQWMESKRDFLLIDIRENWERDNYNIGGEHIVMAELAARQTEIPKDKDVVLYCEKGIRSVIAIQRLEDAGFKNLLNLSGGMKAWREMITS